MYSHIFTMLTHIVTLFSHTLTLISHYIHAVLSYTYTAFSYIHHVLSYTNLAFSLDIHLVISYISPILFSFYINDLPSKLSRVNTSTDIDILLYADDLAILASSREELQHKLNVLSVYCKDRSLKVNVNKSKVMVFNSIKSTEPFML